MKHMPVLYDWKTRGSTSIRWHSLLLMGTAKEPKDMQDTIAAIQPLAACHTSNIVGWLYRFAVVCWNVG